LESDFKKIVSSYKFDFLLVINARFITTNLLISFKNSNPKSRTIIYLWDTLKNLNWNNLPQLLEMYDYRFSFDRQDCLKYPELNLKHRPNFYNPYIDTLNRVENPAYEVASVMSAQPDRIRFLNMFSRIYPKMKVVFYIHLFCIIYRF